MTSAMRGGTRGATVACVQLPARGVTEAEQALHEAERGIRTAADRGADLVILPECTWPGYLIGRRWRQWWSTRAQRDVMRAWSDLARELRVVLVGGIALADGSGLHNCACVWDRDGTLRGRVDKRFLWDFDNAWFEAGRESPVIETSIGRLGVMVCADGRMPEVARSLAVAGAEILLDPTAWVSTGDDPTTWSNPQFQYMMPTRARENGLWLAAANKVGLEADAVAYCGRSCVIDPNGVHVVAAAPDAPDVVVAAVRLRPARFPVPRRPEHYAALSRPTAGSPAGEPPPDGDEASGRVVIDALHRAPGAGDEGVLEDIGTGLFVSTRVDAPRPARAATLICHRGVARLFLGGRRQAAWQPLHEGPRGPAPAPPVTSTPVGRVAAILHDDALVPEIPRALMLAGAQVLVWFPRGDTPDAVVREVGRTRAAENRVYVITDAAGRPAARVYGPDGSLLAASGEVSRYVSAVLAPARTRIKEMAPGTHVVHGRQPQTYRLLTEAPEPVR